MGIEDLLDHRTGRRSFIQNSLTVLLAGAGLPQLVKAEEDYYASAFKAWKRGNLEQAEEILKRGVNASNTKMQAECNYFLGYLEEQKGEMESANSCYSDAFRTVDIQGRYDDEIYEQALRCDFLSQGARVADEKIGTASLKIISRNSKPLIIKGVEWKKYYFDLPKESEILQGYFRNSSLPSQNIIHDFIVDNRESIWEVGVSEDGYLSMLVHKSNISPDTYQLIFFRVEPSLKSKIKAL